MSQVSHRDVIPPDDMGGTGDVLVRQDEWGAGGGIEAKTTTRNVVTEKMSHIDAESGKWG